MRSTLFLESGVNWHGEPAMRGRRRPRVFVEWASQKDGERCRSPCSAVSPVESLALDKSTFGKTHRRIESDNKMIQNLNVNQGQSLFEGLGQELVGATGLGDAVGPDCSFLAEKNIDPLRRIPSIFVIVPDEAEGAAPLDIDTTGEVVWK